MTNNFAQHAAANHVTGDDDTGIYSDIYVLMERPGWWADAACRTAPADVNFFPSKGASAAAAKAVCNTCPACEPCRETAIANDEEHGVFGGTTADEREQIRRQRGLGQRRAPYVHGTTRMYSKGCRLECCVTAMRELRRQQRASTVKKTRGPQRRKGQT